jgi:hypothetical protein
MQFTLASAKAEAGQVSVRNSKMPGSSFAISAKECKAGSKLVTVEGSVCNKCYAVRLQNMRPSVNEGWTNNYLKATQLIERSPERWAQAMAFQIRKAAEKTGQPYHRWFDSGDLQSVAMLRAIALCCALLPDISHWLPTREARFVREYRRQYGDLPSNLVVRVSSTMVGDAPISGHANTSTVHRKGAEVVGHACPAQHQGNACVACRACWSKDVPNVSYPLH